MTFCDGLIGSDPFPDEPSGGADGSAEEVELVVGRER